MSSVVNLALRAGALLSWLVAGAAAAQSVSIVNGPPALQNFSTLANSGTTNAVFPPGWFLVESGGGGRDNEQYAGDNGSSNTGDAYSYGATSSTERAFGGLQSGSLVPVIGARLANDTGAALTALNIQYTGEQWRLGSTGRTDRLDFQYSTNATALDNGTWTDVDALDFVSPQTTTAGAVDGNAGGFRTVKSATVSGFSIPAGATMWVRWLDLDISGAEDGLAIDDVSIGIGADVPPTVISTAPVDAATNVPPSTDIMLTFSEPVQLNIALVTATCTTSGLHSMTGPSGTANSFVLDPSTPFTFNESCTVNVPAAAVADVDGPADNMAAPFAFSFGTAPDTAPTVTSTSPANGGSNVPLAGNIVVNFSEPVQVTGAWFTISCGTSGAHPAAVSGGPSGYVLDPATDFAIGESCTVVIVASQVTDLDGTPQNLAANHQFQFNTTLGSGDYWAGIDTSTAAALRQTVNDRIDDHTPFPYTATSTDAWDILELADEDPANPNRVLDVYRNRVYIKVTDRSGGTDGAHYNREHTWPNSYGFNDVTSLDGGPYAPYTDCHMLYLSAADYNSTRNNKYYDNCPSCTELTTDVNNGGGGGSGVYPGNSNWSNSASFETWNARKGNVARAILYMDIRYDGTTSTAGQREPDLIATDSLALIQTTPNGAYAAVGYMGRLSTLIAWHNADPPDIREALRNDVVFSFQGNRNPFIDHPEWVACVYQSQCQATLPDPLFSNGFE